MSKRIIVVTLLFFLIVYSILGMALGWWAFASAILLIVSASTGITAVLKKVNGGNWSKGPIITAIICLLLSISCILLGFSGKKKSRAHEEDAGIVEVVRYIPNPKYDMYWEIVEGPSFFGRKVVADNERLTERLNADDPERLDFNQEYEFNGEQQVQRFRAKRIRDGRWEGNWEQDKPKVKGRFFLNQGDAGSFSGGMTFEWDDNASGATVQFKPVGDRML